VKDNNAAAKWQLERSRQKLSNMTLGTNQAKAVATINKVAVEITIVADLD
jgi:hypothetical protein